MAIDRDGFMYIAIRDLISTGVFRVSILKKRTDGDEWSFVGERGALPLYSGNFVLTFANDFSTGALYVAFVDSTVDGKLSVMKFDRRNASASWEPVGPRGISTGPINSYLSMVVDSRYSIPYIAFPDSAVVGGIAVMMYNGTSWSVVGSSGLSLKIVNYMSLQFDGKNGILYIAVQNVDNNVYCCYFSTSVLKFVDGVWRNASSSALSIPFSANMRFLSFALDSVKGIPYLAFMNYSAGSRASVLKLENNSWSFAGNSLFSGPSVGSLSLKVDALTGALYIAFSNGAVTVMRLLSDSSTWSVIGSPGFASNGLIGFDRLFMDVDVVSTTPYVGIFTLGKSSVRRPACAAGYAGMNVTSCVPCPAGTYSAIESAFCTPCAAGTFSFRNTTESCQLCAPGSFAPSPGSTNCSLCPAGSYNPDPGSNFCAKCSSGSNSSLMGAVSESTCVQCPAGFYGPASGLAACFPCQPGSYSDIVGSAVCSTCGRGFFSSGSGNKECLACSPGTTSDPGSSACTSASSLASLSSLSVSVGLLVPAFSSGATSFVVSVSNEFPTIAVIPTAADLGSTVKVNGIGVASGSVSGDFSLIAGVTLTLTVTVTAQDGTTTKTYTITVNRALEAVCRNETILVNSTQYIYLESNVSACSNGTTGKQARSEDVQNAADCSKAMDDRMMYAGLIGFGIGVFFVLGVLGVYKLIQKARAKNLVEDYARIVPSSLNPMLSSFPPLRPLHRPS
eukprot:ANDGO_01314.mRNA.1 Putative membrane protein Bcell_0381